MTETPNPTASALPLDPAIAQLEQRYRKMLRVLPSNYRARWENDMLATYLDAAAGRAATGSEAIPTQPTRQERWDVWRLSARLWLSGDPASGKAFAWGQATRSLTLVGLLLHTLILAVVFGANGVRGLNHGVYTLIHPENYDHYVLWKEWLNASLLIPVALWYLTYRYAVRNKTKAWKTFSVLAYSSTAVAVLTSLAFKVHEALASEQPFSSQAFWILLSVGYLLVLAALTLACWAAFHTDAPAVATKKWVRTVELVIGGGALAYFLLMVVIPMVGLGLSTTEHFTITNPDGTQAGATRTTGPEWITVVYGAAMHLSNPGCLLFALCASASLVFLHQRRRGTIHPAARLITLTVMWWVALPCIALLSWLWTFALLSGSSLAHHITTYSVTGLMTATSVVCAVLTTLACRRALKAYNQPRPPVQPQGDNRLATPQGFS